MLPSLTALRSYFETGATRPYTYRTMQLQKLKAAVLAHEEDIYKALYSDLKKNTEEAYATETGLLIAEINLILKNLRHWMRSQPTTTNLMNLPASSRIYRDPLGVVLIISPWNYPFQLALIPLAGAIAGGNCVVLKPSELAPATSAITEKIIREIYPTEFVQVVQGEGSELVPAMMRSFRFDHIFYTGSIPVGKSVYQLAAADLVPVTLELGGKSPAVIEADANIRIAARRIALGKFANTGQTCVAPDYVLVDQSIKDLFVEKLKQTITDFFGEDPVSSKGYGRIINENRFDKLLGYLSQGKIVFGGQHDRKKLFLAPTIMEDVPLDAPLMKEEIFGPVLPVFGFHTMEQALAIIRRNPNPLSFYIFTASSKKEKAWIQSVPFGGGCVNNTAWHFTNDHLPFGGVGYSGIGAYHGKYSFFAFTHAKAVMKSATWIDPGIRYPPFSGKLKWFKLLIR
jgi:aldehyde dehydrogenase (NAD+)